MKSQHFGLLLSWGTKVIMREKCQNKVKSVTQFDLKLSGNPEHFINVESNIVLNYQTFPNSGMWKG